MEATLSMGKAISSGILGTRLISCTISLGGGGGGGNCAADP